MAHFRNDYRLSAADSQRIKCDACRLEGQRTPATTGQNNGTAPFWYHCDRHAQRLREHGSIYTPSSSEVTDSAA